MAEESALAKSLTDLTPYGADKLNTTFTPGPWNAVHAGGSAVDGLPMDSGPVALFYNKTVFDKYALISFANLSTLITAGPDA